MWIVTLGDNTRHSAWNSKKEALHQAEVLQDHGYIQIDRWNSLNDFVTHDDTTHCDNGHYYV